MKDKLLAAVRRYAMLRPGDTVTVAFSGGADSTGLLHLLVSCVGDLGVTVRAAHVNHNLRGEESARDERFARAFCASLGVPLDVLALHRVAGQAKAAGMGVEEYAREKRYEFFAALRGQHGGKIATAHTASDSLETTLFHIARGTGLRGLRGIPPVRGDIIRPLIDCTRAEVESYCAGHGLLFVTDSTNASGAYARNRIRSTVVPALRTVHAGVDAAAVRLRRALETDEDYLEHKAKEALAACSAAGGWDAVGLATLHPALRFRALAMISHSTGAELDAAKARLLEDNLSREGFALELRRGAVLEVRGGLLALRPQAEEQATFEYPAEEGEMSLPDGRVVHIQVTNVGNSELLEKITEKSLKNSLDYDRIQSGLILRGKKPGDRFCPAGRGVTKTLKKLFWEEKIPQEQRRCVPVLVDSAGVVWVHGFGCDERAAVRQTTQKIMTVWIAEGRA